MLIEETTAQVGNLHLPAEDCTLAEQEHLSCEEAGVQGVSRLRDHSKPIQHRLTE